MIARLYTKAYADKFNIEEIIQDVVALQEKALLEVRNVAEEILKETVGTQYFNLEELTEMGHPYSAKHPNPPTPRGVVNLQTGEFYKTFHITFPQYVGGQVFFNVIQEPSEEGEWLEDGKGGMVPRPYARLIQDRLNRILEKVLYTQTLGAVQAYGKVLR